MFSSFRCFAWMLCWTKMPEGIVVTPGVVTALDVLGIVLLLAATAYLGFGPLLSEKPLSFRVVVLRISAALLIVFVLKCVYLWWLACNYDPALLDCQIESGQSGTEELAK